MSKYVFIRIIGDLRFSDGCLIAMSPTMTTQAKIEGFDFIIQLTPLPGR